MSNDLAGLNHELDNCIARTLSLLADWYEDSDDPWTAAGYRKLADGAHLPRTGFTSDGTVCYVWETASNSHRHHGTFLPPDVRSRLLLGYRNCEPATTMSIAYHRTATVWGMILKEQAERYTTRIICPSCRRECNSLTSNHVCAFCDERP